eukprot:gene17852-biopygen23377
MAELAIPGACGCCGLAGSWGMREHLGAGIQHAYNPPQCRNYYSLGPPVYLPAVM